jgi:hypothetical protein
MNTYKKGLFITKNGAYIIYLREQIPNQPTNQWFDPQYTIAQITRNLGNYLEIVDNYPDYLHYGSTFSSQFYGFLDEPKLIMMEKSKFSDDLSIVSIFTTRKQKNTYPGKIIYCCSNLSSSLEDLPPTEISKYVHKN